MRGKFEVVTVFGRIRVTMRPETRDHFVTTLIFFLIFRRISRRHVRLPKVPKGPHVAPARALPGRLRIYGGEKGSL